MVSFLVERVDLQSLSIPLPYVTILSLFFPSPRSFLPSRSLEMDMSSTARQTGNQEKTPTNAQIYPNTAGKLERLASSRPHRVFLSCPVFGIPRAAESADLVLAMSGDYYAKKHAAHALVPAIARKVMDLGSNVERAMSFK